MNNRNPPVISLTSSPDFQKDIDKAAEVLLSGGVVAYPTESFYGLAVDVANESAVRRLFFIKKRPLDSPILILIPSADVLDKYVKHIPPVAFKLMDEFWPGGLTMVFDARPNISFLLTGGTKKIGIRLSSHRVATLLANALKAPVSGTSANISAMPPCKTAQEVLRSLGKNVDMILDDGETSGEKGSTLIDVTVEPPRILREGMISESRLRKFISR